MTSATLPIRVNYGCGDTRLEGYVGVDVRTCRGADFVVPAWDTSPFEPASVEEVYSRHMLEHLTPCDARRTLSGWLKILQPDGLLRLIVPDLAFHARQLLGEATSWTDDSSENQEHALAGFYGWQDPSCGGSNEDSHRWGYTWESLTPLLGAVGYVAIRRIREGPDSEPWHLHVTAHKPDPMA